MSVVEKKVAKKLCFSSMSAVAGGCCSFGESMKFAEDAEEK